MSKNQNNLQPLALRFAAVFAVAVLAVTEARAATFTVDSTGDGGDSNTADGVCDDGTGSCTLRAAIEQANATGGTDTIEFAIGGVGVPTISPGSTLPTITDPVTIDGTTEAAGMVELDGSGVSGDGLKITAGSSMVKGLVIHSFAADGIDLSTNGGNTIVGNYIGTDTTGTVDLGNSLTGVRITDVPNNTIGGTAPGDRNVISGNGRRGIYMSGTGATGNVIEGNYIGTDVTGTVTLGNDFEGVYLDGAPGNTVGGTAGGAGNLISGNVGGGVLISGTGATGNRVEGNFIGTDVTGTVALPNVGGGVHIRDTSNNTIGGAAPGAGNLVSGNPTGVQMSINATGNVVAGNFIGTDVTGTLGLPNTTSGISLSHSPNNTIGGTVPGARNVISANGVSGILIAGVGSTGNKVEGNLIGTDVTGTVDLGNTHYGVLINQDASNNKVGGTVPGARNIISGNGRDGIRFQGTLVTGNKAEGNYIGTDVTGTLDLGNTHRGVFIVDAPGNIIGGTAPGAGNVISGNDIYGVEIFRSTATGNRVEGNYIGTDATGTLVLGNSSHGVEINDSASGNTIGGTTAAAGNVIWWNGGHGVSIRTIPTGNAVRGNSIAFNAGDGVNVDSGNGNLIDANSIHANGELGIDLSPAGVTPNDAGDPDVGANKRQNFPVLTSVVISGGVTTIEGTLNSAPSTDFTLQFFSSSVCDPSGYGEGETFLGSSIETTDGGGDVTFTVVFGTPVPAGHIITATATDSNNNTSEFSECAAAPLCGNGVVETGEECDPPGDAACPGQCIPPALPNECTCPPCGPCPTDVDGNGSTDAFDLANLLGCWGPVTPGGPCECFDADGNGIIDAFDLAVLLGSWGPCA